MFYKILNDIVSVNFAQYLQPSSSITRGHNQRFIPICARSNIYHHSFLPSVIRMWNALPSELVSADNIEEFKSKLHICTYTHNWGFCASNQKSSGMITWAFGKFFLWKVQTTIRIANSVLISDLGPWQQRIWMKWRKKSSIQQVPTIRLIKFIAGETVYSVLTVHQSWEEIGNMLLRHSSAQQRHDLCM